MIIQFSTGGRGRDPSARGSSLYLRPDMASLSTGSVNFQTIVYENSAALVADLAEKMLDSSIRPRSKSSTSHTSTLRVASSTRSSCTNDRTFNL